MRTFVEPLNVTGAYKECTIDHARRACKNKYINRLVPRHLDRICLTSIQHHYNLPSILTQFT